MEELITTDTDFYLRPLKETDTLLLKPLLEEEESVAFFTERDLKNFRDAKSLVTWLYENGEYYVLERIRDRAVAGIAGTRPADKPGTRRLAYMLGRRFRGKGLMPAVIEAISKRCFENEGVERIEAAIRPENIKSLRCIEKAGYVFDHMSESEEDGVKSKKMIYVSDKTCASIA